MKTEKRELILAAACFADAAISGAVLFLILYQNGAFIPRWVSWEEKELASGEISCVLKDRRMTVSLTDGSILFTSPEQYKIQDCIIDDIDGDGNTEIVTLLWKIGSYGQHLPFWVKQNDHNWGQHIFIYRYDGIFNSVWCTSYIPFETDRWIYDPSTKFIHIYQHDGGESDWVWASWGLSEV